MQTLPLLAACQLLWGNFFPGGPATLINVICHVHMTALEINHHDVAMQDNHWL
jgi:hypothetical protein